MNMLRGIGVLALLAGWTLGGLAVHAQAPTGTAPSKMFTNKQQFRLPFNLDERERQRLREIQLYVKYNGDTWTCKETAGPMQKAFTFRATQDGEYWFSIVTIDAKTGRPTPTDVAKEPPALIVVVDTQQPEVQVSAASRGGEECLRCDVRDANPDPSRVKLEYQAHDRSWRPLEPVPGSPELFRFPEKNAWTGQLRASATDRADNTGTRELTWNMPAPAVETAAHGPARVDSHSEKTTVAGGPDLLPPPVQTSAVPMPPAMPTPASQPSPIQQVAGREPIPANLPPVPTTTHEPNLPGREQSLANRQLLNSTHVVLDYRIDQVGPSGVSKVEVWMTPDEGRTWQRLCEDPDRRSPAEFDLPREGLYGISIVVTNGNSISDPPPQSGSAPDYWIEVDTTRPTAQLQSVRPGTGDDAGTLLITWAASDKNLGNEPIDLYYATSREGPWVAIRRGVHNDGTFRWEAPRDGVGRYYIRLDVTDRAGNLARCETPDVVVLDLTHPKAKVLGASASVSSQRPLNPPTGN
jgi:hypothetical protein